MPEEIPGRARTAEGAAADSAEGRRKPRKREGFFARYLKRLAQSNYESFGGQPLDCCQLHQSKAPQCVRGTPDIYRQERR